MGLAWPLLSSTRRGMLCVQIIGDVQDEPAETSSAGPASEPASGSTNGASGAAEQDDEALDKLFRDPAVQEMLYQHLPETMRNKETFEWMLNNPEYRKQLQDVLKKQVRDAAICSPSTTSRNFEQAEATGSLQSAGVKPRQSTLNYE